jgi:hypothetical protein
MRANEAPSFCEQKEAKKLFESGAWDVATALPHPGTSIKKVFACFFQKALLAFGYHNVSRPI